MVGEAPRLLIVDDVRSLGERIAASDFRFTYGERLNFLGEGKRFRCNFIEPGVVSYRDVGGDVELLKRETIEAALESAIGNPLTVGHVRTNRLVTNAHGRVDSVGRDEKTGWFFCEGSVETDDARAKMRANSKPSCGYTVLSFGPGGVWHNVPYAREITAIKFHHLAIVDNPRYEGADFRLNAKTKTENPAMKNPFKWIKNILQPAAEAGGTPQTIQEAGELPADATLEVDGAPVTLEALTAGYRANAIATAPAKDEPATINAGDTVEIDGAPVKVSDLVAGYRANALRSAAETPAAKAAREAAEKAKRESSQREADRKTAEERRNEGASHFRVLSSARSTPAPVVTERHNSSDSLVEKAARGADRYGSAPAGKN